MLPHEGRAIRVRGLVQGVGYRPTVCRLARDDGVVGEIWNDAEGVMIRAWADVDTLDRFLRRLRDDAPPLAHVDAIEAACLDESAPYGEFRILASETAGRVRTGIVPDAATCRACLADTRDPAGRRYRYPFTNCTHCGPRLSIVRGIPYDRANTTMAAFSMCADCRAEYENPADRRFHAQPNACPLCGPQVTLEPSLREDAEPIVTARRRLAEGAIVAIKGLGGYHLAVDACNAEAVERLRARKRRDHKPFALMARDLEMIWRYCVVSAAEQALLSSPATPIVILAVSGPDRVAEAVAPGQRCLGFMLPYSPLHHLLLTELDRPIVLTSGNRSDEPQCIGDDEARDRLGGIADWFLGHNREIANRVDDSVARVMDDAPRLLRRARGYCPRPLSLPPGFERAPPLVALGGELKNTFCLVKDGQAILSQHIGDLEHAAAFSDYRRTLALYLDLYQHAPSVIAVDLHPEYLSSKLGHDWASRESLRVEGVQHHHAHVASCMAENGVPLHTAPILGVALDGLGWGEDDTIWGGEFLLATYRTYTRVGRFNPVAMIGGAKAVHEPWRNTYAHIRAAMGWPAFQLAYPRIAITRFLATQPLTTLDAMIEHGINSPPASSCGRLFDAVAAAVGLCREEAGYEGHAAVRLEASVDERALDDERGYEFPVDEVGGLATLQSAPMWRALADDLERDAPVWRTAARFHRGLADALIGAAADLAQAHAVDTVALSGGVFQNRTLFERVAAGLRGAGLTVLCHSAVPANDGGLALGQAAVAAARALAPPGGVE